MAFTPPETDTPVFTPPAGDTEASFTPPQTDAQVSPTVARFLAEAPEKLAADRDFPAAHEILNTLGDAATPADVDKLAKLKEEQHKQPFSVSRLVSGIHPIDAAEGFLKGGWEFAKKGFQASPAGVAVNLATGRGLAPSREAAAEMGAGLETAALGDVKLAKSGFDKLHAAMQPVSTRRDMTPEDWKTQLFQDAANAQQQDSAAHAQGEIAKLLGTDADTLAKQGISIDPKAVENLSQIEDPLNFVPLGAGFEVVTKTGQRLFTAATKEAAQGMVAKLGEAVKAVGAKTGEIGDRLKKVSPLTAMGGIISGNPKVIAAAAAPYAVRGAGKVIEAGGKVLTGELDGPIIRLGKSAAEGAAAGTAASVPFALAAEDEKQAGGIVGAGMGIGALGGAAGHVVKGAQESLASGIKNTISKAFEAGDHAPTEDFKGYGTDPALDAAHQSALETMKQADPAGANFANRFQAALPAILREFGWDEKKQGPAPELYLLKANDFDAANPQFAGQEGAFDKDSNRLFVRVDDGSTRSLFHEPAHLIWKVLPEATKKDIFSSIQETYSPEQIEKFGNDYTDWVNNNAPEKQAFSQSDILEEIAVEHLANVLRGSNLDGMGAKPAKKLARVATGVMQAMGYIRPELGKTPNGETVSPLGVGLAPKISNKLASIWDTAAKSEDVKGSVNPPPVIGGEKPFVPPATDTVVTSETPVDLSQPNLSQADLSQPKEGLLTAPPKELFEQSPPPYVREGNPPVGLATEPPPAELFGGFGSRPNVEVPAAEEGHASVKPQAPTVRAEEFGAPEPAPAKVAEEKPSNIRVTPEQQAKLNRPPERTDIGIQEAEAALKDASPEQQAVFNQIREHLNQPQGDISPVEVTYNSVTPEDTAPATERTARRAEQAGQESRTAAQKLVVPTGFTVTNGGKVQVTGYSPDKVLSNASRIAADASKKDAAQLIPYALKDGQFTPEAEAKFYRDLQTYSSNQANGYAGSGKTLLRPKDFTGYLPPENPAYTPKPLSEQVASFLNLSMGIAPPKTARVSKSSFTGEAIKPTNVRARELAEANIRPALKPGIIGDPEKQVFKDFGNVEIAEFNPLRKQLDEHGVNTRERIETTERLNLDQIQSVTPKPESSFRAPVADAISAGFMPRRAEAPASIEDFSKLSPDDFKRAVLTSPGGLTGTAISLGKKLSPESLKEISALIDQAHMKAGEFKAKGDWDNALAEASRGQFFREASEAARASKGETGLSVTPDRLDVPRAFMPDTRGPVRRQSDPEAREVASGYMEGLGKKYVPDNSYSPVNVELAKRLADYYDQAKNNPEDPQVKASYQALADETMAQYDAMKKAGIEIEPWSGKGEPYHNSAEMMADVRDNKHLYFFRTDEGFGQGEAKDSSNPMLRPSGEEVNGTPLLVNDVFRAVHDYFGHVKEGNQFGPRGEFNAWKDHSQMFSDKAQGALAAETLAQNSWVNYGAHMRDEQGGIRSNVPLTERPFAEQKATTVPNDLIDEARGQGAVRFMPSSGLPKDLSNTEFWHGARVGRRAGEAGKDGLIFGSVDKDYAHSFIDPLEKHTEQERASNLSRMRVSVENPKVFHSDVDSEWKQFTERGISADSLTKEGHDSAVLVDKDGKVIDIAVADPSKASFSPGANFMPKRDEFTPEKIKEAAYRLKSGKVFTGKFHGEAYEKIEKALGKLSPDQFEKAVEEMKDGFVTDTGRFVNRSDAAKLAIDAEQMTPEGYRKAVKDLWDVEVQPTEEGLDALSFENARTDKKFMPRRGGEVTGAPAIEDFKDESKIGEALTKPGWAILTATQEALGSGTDKVNVAANAKLETELKKGGYEVVPVDGNYKGVDQGRSFLVTGIDPEAALEIGKRYKQESVLTKDGLLYGDGTRNPVDPSTTSLGDYAKQQDFYSQIQGGPAFSLGIDFSTREPVQPAGGALRFMPDMPVQFEADEPLPNAVGKGEELRVVHYSTSNVSEVDPKHFGKGQATKSDLRGDNKAFFFVAGSPLGRDKQFFGEGGKQAYGAKIDGSQIYDLSAGKPDPLGWGTKINRLEADEVVKDAGYKGILIDTGEHDGRKVVLMYEPVKVSSLGKPDPGEGAVRFMPARTDLGKKLEQEHGLEFRHEGGPGHREVGLYDGSYEAGSISSKQRGSVAGIGLAEINPFHRNKGIGEALYRELATALQGDKATEVRGNVISPQPLAIRRKVFGNGDVTLDGKPVSVDEAISKLAIARANLSPKDPFPAVNAAHPIDPNVRYMPSTPKARTEAAAEKFPEALPIRYRRDEDGKIKYKDGAPVPVEYDYELFNTPLAKEAAKGIKGDDNREAAVAGAYADRIANAYDEIKDNPEIMAGKGWYSTFREKVKKLIGDDAEIFSQFLAATSARTPVEDNYRQAIDAYNIHKSGDYDPQVAKYKEGQRLNESGELQKLAAKDLGTDAESVSPERALRWWVDKHDLLPMKTNGKKYNANSYQVLRVLAGTWKDEVGGPKTPNFAGNLSGSTLEATIDVWAARFLRRLGYEGLTDKKWRILPENETGVNDPDFYLGQKAFRAAADKLGMNPDDLQAIMWFAEKDAWEKRGWTTSAAGIAKSDFNSLLSNTEKDAFGSLKLVNPQTEFGLNFVDLRKKTHTPTLGKVPIKPAKKAGQKASETLQLGL